MRFQKLFGLRAEALLIEAIRALLLFNGNQRNHSGVDPLLPANVKTVFRLLTEPLSTSHLLEDVSLPRGAGALPGADFFGSPTRDRLRLRRRHHQDLLLCS